MPHMLNAEHFGIYDAMLAGDTRDDATIANALSQIGSLNRRLLIPFTGDGVWTLNNDTTFPINVIVEVAPGVTVAGTGNLTFNGQIVAYDPDWYTGSGTLSVNVVPAYFGAIVAKSLGMNITTAGAQIHVSGDSAWPAVIRLEERTAGNGGTAVQFYSNNVSRGKLGLPGTQDITLNLENSARFVVSGGNMGIGVPAPTHQLQLSTDDAAKLTTTTWTTTSDARLKEILRDYTDGLSLIQAVHPVWFTYNGNAQTPTDGQEHVGIIAQELQPHAPYMIGTMPAKLHDEDVDSTDLLTYQGHAMTFALVNAVKELASRVEQLEAALATAQRPAA